MRGVTWTVTSFLPRRTTNATGSPSGDPSMASTTSCVLVMVVPPTLIRTSRTSSLPSAGMPGVMSTMSTIGVIFSPSSVRAAATAVSCDDTMAPADSRSLDSSVSSGAYTADRGQTALSGSK